MQPKTMTPLPSIDPDFDQLLDEALTDLPTRATDQRRSQPMPTPDTEMQEVSLTIDLGDEESPFVTYKRTFNLPVDMDDPDWDTVHALVDTLVKMADTAIDTRDVTDLRDYVADHGGDPHEMDTP